MTEITCACTRPEWRTGRFGGGPGYRCKQCHHNLPDGWSPQPGEEPYDSTGKILSSHRVHVWQDKPWKPNPCWNARCFECDFGFIDEVKWVVRAAALEHIRKSEITEVEA